MGLHLHTNQGFGSSLQFSKRDAFLNLEQQSIHSDCEPVFESSRLLPFRKLLIYSLNLSIAAASKHAHVIDHQCTVIEY